MTVVKIIAKKFTMEYYSNSKEISHINKKIENVNFVVNKIK